MKGYVLNGINDFSLKDIDIPRVRENEVLVKVRAAGICGSDIPRIYTTGAHRHPIVLGHEFAGEVCDCNYSTKEAKAWAGKRVGVFPLIPCQECQPCLNKRYEMCRNYNYLGSRCDGGFAEYVAVPMDNLIELPDSVTFEQAAMLEPMAVAVHAMRGFEIDKDDSVVICGLGTIGLMLIMFLKDLGVKNILAIGNKDFQYKKALEFGITEENFCDSRKVSPDKWINDRTKGQGVDIFFECVGKNETFSLGVDSLAPLGKLMLVGNPYSDMGLSKDIYWKILRNQLTVKGTWNSSFTGDENDDWHYVLNRISSGDMGVDRLISHRFSMEDFGKGFLIMRDKTEDYIKIMGEF